MKFNIKNLFNKKSLKKLEKATLVGVASLALVIPLAGNTGALVHAAHHSHYYYENLIYDPGSEFLTDEDEMKLIWQHPFLKHTHIVKMYFEGSRYWDGAALDFYAHHFKQLYSPNLYRYMIKKIPGQNYAYLRHDEKLLYRDQEQMGLLGHHRSRRHARRQSYRRTHRTSRHHQRNRRQYSHKRHENRRKHVTRHRNNKRY